jgi:folate-binding protein YgfZ
MDQPFLIVDRSGRGKLRLTGPQRAWYLHQITTQAFEEIPAGESRDAAMLTVHGRMVGFLEVVATDDQLLCHFEPELVPELPDAIRRYVFATQVEIEDADDMGLILTTGAADVGVPAVEQDARWIGVPARHLWVRKEDVPAGLKQLEEAGGEIVDEAAIEALRVSHGVPRWGREMDTKTFPQEAGIDTVAVHYDKGCYTGQEAMAKIHFRGKVNRKLVQLESSTELAPGWDVFLDGARIGSVTSAASGPDGSFYGLALVKHDVPSGTDVRAGDVPARLSDAA